MKYLAEALKDLGTQIAESAGSGKIAIVPFVDLDGRTNKFGIFAAEELTTVLFNTRKVEIVERRLRDKLLQELKLGESGVVDPASARQAGKILGARAVVIGTFTAFDAYVAINCRMVDTETGKILGAASAQIRMDADLRLILDQPTTAATPSSEHLAAVPKRASSPTADMRYRRQTAVTDFLTKCAQRPYGITEERISKLLEELDAIGPPLLSNDKRTARRRVSQARNDHTSASQRDRDLKFVAEVEQAIKEDPAVHVLYYIDSLLRLSRVAEAEDEVYRTIRGLRPRSGNQGVWLDLAAVRKVQGDFFGAYVPILIILSSKDGVAGSTLPLMEGHIFWIRGMSRQRGWSFDFENEIRTARSALSSQQ